SPRLTTESARLLSPKLLVNVLGIQFEDVVVVVEEVQRPIGARPYELAPHRLKFGDGSLEDLRRRAKGNVITGPGTLNGRANQHHPYPSQSDEGFAMALRVLALSHTGAEEVMKQSSRPGRVAYYEGYVADRFEHGTLPSGKTRSPPVIGHRQRPPLGLHRTSVTSDAQPSVEGRRTSAAVCSELPGGAAACPATAPN